MLLSQEFFARGTIIVAQELLGKELVFLNNWNEFRWIINEVEAYTWAVDPASHAYRGITPRTRVMFETYGHSYIYFIYGNYFCLNVTTENIWSPWAVLIRSVIPLKSVNQMILNRKRIYDQKSLKWLTDGPGKLCQAFWLTLKQNGLLLNTENWLYIEETAAKEIIYKTWPRIGISKWQEHPWRFWYENPIWDISF